MSYLKQAEALQAMVNQGQILDAFEKFYHQDVVMQELGEEPRVGKDANREYEKNFVSMIKEVHGGDVVAITADESKGITMIESWMDVTFIDGNRVKMEQVAVQTWAGEFVKHEKFYHK